MLPRLIVQSSSFHFFLALSLSLLFFFFNHTASTEIYTLSLHDALPISVRPREGRVHRRHRTPCRKIRRSLRRHALSRRDRKSTRLNSSHRCISYAVFCLKKKKNKKNRRRGTYKPYHARATDGIEGHDQT